MGVVEDGQIVDPWDCFRHVYSTGTPAFHHSSSHAVMQDEVFIASQMLNENFI